MAGWLGWLQVMEQGDCWHEYVSQAGRAGHGVVTDWQLSGHKLFWTTVLVGPLIWKHVAPDVTD